MAKKKMAKSVKTTVVPENVRPKFLQHPENYDYTEFSIEGYNDLSYNGCGLIKKALGNIGCTLTHLSLSNCKMDDGMITTITLTINASKLTNVSFENCGVGNIGAFAVGEMLGANARLTCLNLQKNNIGDDGVSHIGKALSQNATLQVLYLNKNKIGDPGAVSIGEALSSNSALKQLALQENEIGDGGATYIGKGLASNTRLNRIDLFKNQIGDNGAFAIAEGLEKNSSLKLLTLNENMISESVIVALMEAGEKLGDNLKTYAQKAPELQKGSDVKGGPVEKVTDFIGGDGNLKNHAGQDETGVAGEVVTEEG